MKPVWKWVTGVVVFLLALLVGLVWYFSNNWEPIIEKKLKEVVKNSTDSLYQLSYDNLSINIALGNVSMQNVVLHADSNVYAQLEANKKAPDNRYHIELKSLKIKRFGLLGVLANRKLDVKSIALEKPIISVYNTYHSYNDTLSNQPKKSLYESVREVLSSVNVRDVYVEGVDFKYFKIREGKSSETQLSDIRIRVHDFLLDETSVKDTTRFYYTKLIDVDIPGFQYDLSDGIYGVKFDSLKINTRDRNVLFTNVDYKPNISKTAYFKSKNKAKLMTVLHFDTLRMEQVDFKSFIENQQTLMKTMQVKNGHVKLYADKRVPKKATNQIGQSPHQKLMFLKRLMRIDTVLVDNIGVEYGEISDKYHREGVITFDHTTGYLANVTNDLLRLENNKYLIMDVHSKVMNAGNLHTQFSFDMLSKSGEYSYKGTVGNMRASAFNKILHPLVNVEIASGDIRSIRFDMKGNDVRTWGDFRFNYDNMQVSLLGERDAEGRQKSKKVLSFLVNKVIINDSNPDANEVYHIGKVNYKRVTTYPFFKNLWKSLLEGIKQTAGISKEREARIMNQAERTEKTVTKTKGFFKGLFRKKETNE